MATAVTKQSRIVYRVLGVLNEDRHSIVSSSCNKSEVNKSTTSAYFLLSTCKLRDSHQIGTVRIAFIASKH